MRDAPELHEQVGDPTFADGILDRLVHNAHLIERERRACFVEHKKMAA
jgi:hypothetical protein